MYLEGGDQYRGWFHSSLLVGVSALGGSPYRAVITHGWVLDAEGKTMHKSLGNAIEPQDIIKDRGAEILRLWSAMVNYQEDVRLSEEMLLRLSESYRKIRNTWRFMLGVLEGFSPGAPDAAPRFSESDLYILQRLQEVKARVLQAYRDFEYHAIFHAMFNFFSGDLSSFYLNFQKDNLYCNRRDDPQRRASQQAVFILLRETLLLMAPILSFTCEEAWGFLPDYPGKAAFIHLERFPGVDEKYPPGGGRAALGEDHRPARPHPEGDRDGPRRQAHRRFPGSRRRDHRRRRRREAAAPGRGIVQIHPGHRRPERAPGKSGEDHGEQGDGAEMPALLEPGGRNAGRPRQPRALSALRRRRKGVTPCT